MIGTDIFVGVLDYERHNWVVREACLSACFFSGSLHALANIA